MLRTLCAHPKPIGSPSPVCGRRKPPPSNTTRNGFSIRLASPSCRCGHRSNGQCQMALSYNATWQAAEMTPTEYVVDVFGGPSVFKGRSVPTSIELRARIREGLPYRSFESVRERLRLSIPETATVLHMAARTLARR